jgi:hypothetical protein
MADRHTDRQSHRQQNEHASAEWGAHPKTGLAVALLRAGRSAPEDATTAEIVSVATRADQEDRHPREIWRCDDVSG